LIVRAATNREKSSTTAMIISTTMGSRASFDLRD
jgi:hypothetical protein